MGGKIIFKIHRYAELAQPCMSKSESVKSSRRRLGGGEMREKGEIPCQGESFHLDKCAAGKCFFSS